MAIPQSSQRLSGTGLPGLGAVLPRVILIIAVIEVLIMVAFSKLPPLPTVLETIVDAASLSLLSAPLIYLWIIRPLRRRLEAHMQAEIEYSNVMRDSASRYSAVLETAPDGIIVMDEQGRIESANTAIEAIFGWRPEELLGQNVSLLMNAQDAGEHHGHVMRQVGGSGLGIVGQRTGRRLTARRKDGTQFSLGLHVSAAVLGEHRVFTGVLRDLTEEVRREESLRQSALALERLASDLTVARDAAESAARTKSEFLATMSHEIRTPMNGVLGFTHLLLDTALSESQRDWVQTIRGSGQALLTIINDILDSSKIEAGKLEMESLPYDMHRVISDVRELMRPQAEAKGLRIESHIADGLPQIMLGDEGRVRQVLINLVGNAVKFTDKGYVRVELSAFEAADGARCVRLAVHDTGIGIAEENRSLLFQQFQQVDGTTTRRFGGTGLGLAISRRLVEMMGGEIGVNGARGGGSTFWLTLPLPLAPVMMPERDDEPNGGAPLLKLVERVDNPVRVLVAEDNSVNAKLVRFLLEKQGCRVDVAGNGLEVLAMAEQFDYDLVLMDCHMPEMDGFTATRELRGSERGRNLRIVALTASALPEDREACFAAGMDDFLSKPIVPSALLGCVQKYAA